jgi:hypothetical protein
MHGTLTQYKMHDTYIKMIKYVVENKNKLLIPTVLCRGLNVASAVTDVMATVLHFCCILRNYRHYSHGAAIC